MLNNPAVLSCLQTDSGNGDYLPIHHIGNQYISLCTLEDGDLFHQGRDAISAGFLTGPRGLADIFKTEIGYHTVAVRTRRSFLCLHPFNIITYLHFPSVNLYTLSIHPRPSASASH